MRSAFIETLTMLAEADPRIWLLCGDLGYSVLERFAQRFPERYLNVGVAEQNMTGVAAGLALSGKIVFTYSIANFPTLRPLEQIRNDICYHNANVKIVAVGGGLAYGTAGYTHHGLEDIAALRSLPNMSIVAPGDPLETQQATEVVAAHSGPCYLRLGKGGELVVHQAPPVFQLGKAIWLKHGEKVTLISTGSLLGESVNAANQLAAYNIPPNVISMPTIKPLDIEAVLTAAETSLLLVTLEEHSITGGLGSAVAEVIADNGLKVFLIRIGVVPGPYLFNGSQTFLRRQYGLDASGIVERVLLAMKRI